MARRIAVITTAAAVGVVWLGPLGLPAAQAEPDCRPLVIGVGGNGEQAAQRAGVHTMMDAHLDQAAAEGNRVESVDYSSSVWPTGPYTKDQSVAEGERVLAAQIANYRAECPGGHVKVIGHSLGAEVAGNQAALADEVVLYGDPRRPGGIYDAIPGVYPGTSNPDHRDPAPNVTSVCHEYDFVCDSPAPWSDPVRFGLGVQGFLFGWHGYAPNEGADWGPGDHYVEKPSPNPNIPQNTPTGVPPIVEPLPLPAWEPGPLPNMMDANPIIDAFTPQPYTPTPIRDYTPEWVDPLLPPQVLDFVPPPLPALPPLPTF
ncbi:PE-PPE domain-containing protein [Nocardia higoensis]|uniref:PE-PPE domain-containing protein n=1 Tax=Nocardia higoensis TaxID=228599 RepID=A0ABS0DI93_9NOCA|nr:PE-PPE domain-containing protein [Nocardia higoensis]MBF6358181.1 PE-PPE domain-containing protein [Nocardia higoensis]